MVIANTGNMKWPLKLHQKLVINMKCNPIYTKICNQNVCMQQVSRLLILPPSGRPSSLMLNSMVSVSDDHSLCSLIAHTKTDARSTPHDWKSVFIFWMDIVVRTTLNTSFLTAFISFLVEHCSITGTLFKSKHWL